MISEMAFGQLKRREITFVDFREKVREQAAKNALTLFTIAFFAIITWSLMLISVIYVVGHNGR